MILHAGAAAVEPTPDGLGAAIAAFRPVDLQQLGAAALMDRVDTKFLLPRPALVPLLQRFAPHYRLLEVGGSRLARYHTVYYDTPELLLYHAHHAGRTPRYKVRARTYVGSGDRYLEVKLRSGAGRTRKVRMRITHHAGEPLAVPGWTTLLGVGRGVPTHRLVESLRVEFTRLTLVRDDAPERITLDCDVTVSRGGSSRTFPDVVIAEVKQERQGRSHFRDAARAFRLRPGALSKYCLGIATLEPAARRNTFRPTLRRIEGMCGRSLPTLHR